MKIKRKRKLSHTSLKRHHPTTNMALTAALLHSPSTHSRAEGVRGRLFRLEIQKWSLNFMWSREEEMQTKRHTFSARSMLPNRLKDGERGNEPSKSVPAN